MRPLLRAIRAAFVFLTRIPVGGFPYTREEWRWAPAHFPFVGAVLGAALGPLAMALRPLSELAAALLVIGASLLVTGAFHEDGLADTFDALGGTSDREKVFVILKDSRVGTFGAAALVVSIAGRAALLARVGDDAWWALAFAMCAARVGPIWQMVALPYATNDAVAKSKHVARAGLAQALVATGWLALVAGGLVACHALSPARLGAAVTALAAVVLLSGFTYARRVQGVTGDFLGATEQLGELAALAVLAYRP